MYGKPVLSEENQKVPEVFQSITNREVQDFIARWFVPDQSALAVIVPGGGEA